MAVTRVGSASTTAITSSSPLVAAYSQAPTAGNLLVMGVTAYGGGSSPTCATPTGWTAGPTGGATTTLKGMIFLFWKVATGGDADPSMATYNQSRVAATIEEWSASTGWMGAPHDADSTVGTKGLDSTAAGTCNSGPLTTTAPGFVWSFLGAAVSPAAKTLTWAGGSASSGGSYTPVLQTATAVQSPSVGGTYTPTLSFPSDANTWYVGATASMAFKTATDAPSSAFLAFF